MNTKEGAGLPVDIAKTRDKLALAHYEKYEPLDQENKDSVNWIAPRFSAFCYGFDAAYLAEQKKCKRLREALEVCLQALEREIFRQEKDDGGAFNHLTNAIAKAEEILGNVSAAPNEEKT